MVDAGSGIPGAPNVKDTAQAVEAIMKAVPVYQDLVQPTAQEVGTLMARTVHAALAPLRAVIWGVDKIEEYVEGALTKRLQGIPPEWIQTPEPTVAGPALEALRFAGKEETLRELYANLLATAMDRQTAEQAHPAFVDVIRQMTPDEAKIVTLISATRPVPRPLITVRAEQPPASGIATDEGGSPTVGPLPRSVSGSYVVRLHFSLLGEEAGCQHPHLTSNYVENLCRLALIEIPPGRSYTDKSLYESLENHPTIAAVSARIEQRGHRPKIEHESIIITNFGVQFFRACVVERGAG